MSYRIKLFISFSVVILISALTGLGTFYFKAKEFAFSQLRSQIYSVGMAYSDSFNPQYLMTIDSEAATETQKYHELILKLRELRDINRRSDFYLNFVTLFKKDSSGNFIYIADAEEDPSLVSRYGDSVLFDSNEKNWDQKDPYVDTTESIDQWGHWISGFFPIKDSQGQIVAYLELDLYFSNFLNKLYILMGFGLIGLSISLILGLLLAIYLSSKMTKDIKNICSAVEEIGRGNFLVDVKTGSHDEIGVLGKKINEMGRQLEEKERIKTSFGKYVSQHILEKILADKSIAKLEGEKRKITVLFSDIRNFTQISEKLPPETVVGFLNEYFEKMIEIVFKYHGTLDKFIGDGMMVEFGVPLDDTLQEVNAVLAAIEMQKTIQNLREKWKGCEYENIAVGIGIHTGEAIVGNIGSSKRMEYTAIGDTVNVASRLEFLTKEMGKEIIVSEQTYQVAQTIQDLKFELIGKVSLKGRVEEVTAYYINIS